MSKNLFLTSCVVLAVLTGISQAADVNWTNGSGDGLWTTAANWNPPFVPEIAYQDKARINSLPGPIIRAGMAAQCQWLALSDGSPGAITVTGGTFNVSGTGDSWTIIGYGVTDDGTLTIDGGTMTTSNRVFVGFQGKGTIVINGGTMNVGGTLGVGFGESAFNTGRGYVYLNGGVLNVEGTFQMSSPEGALGHLDISNGTLSINGDRRSTVEGFINNGHIVGFGGLGVVNVQYNGSRTILTAQMNPYVARVPQPANNALEVPPYVTLGWMPGDTAVTQNIYFGTNANDVLEADTSTTGIYQGSFPAEQATYKPSSLNLEARYFWRVDSVDETETHRGNLWQFTVADFALVDDFEAYADTDAMLLSWSAVDSGAVLSLATSGGHDSNQAIRFDYDNSGAGEKPYYSEARTIGIDKDWTISDVLAVDIWYKGAPGNAAEPMYAALEDDNGNPIAVIVNSNENAAKAPDWQVWRIELAEFSGVDLTNVKSFSIGFGDRNEPVAGGAGTIYLDDIALFQSRCLFNIIADINGDCVVDLHDFQIMAENWLGVSGI